MASRNQQVTTDPTALANTVAGQEYAIQNLGTQPVYSDVASAPPEASKQTFAIGPLEFLYQTPGAGESIFVWVGDGRSHVAYEETS